MDSSPRSLASHFSRLADPRSPEKVRHKLLDLVILAVLAALSGADAWTEVESFAEDQEDWLRTFLELPGGIPSHDTLGRVFSRIDAKAFTDCFLSWVQAIRPVLPRDIVALDGKTLRRSFDTASEKSALHMVSAFSHASGLVLGQRAVEDKSNEITAIPELLKMRDLKGCIVTIDAMGCQKAIAAEIVKRKADYVLALKGNQGLMNEDISEYFRWAREEKFRDIPHSYAETTEKSHGRIEIRRVWATEDLDWLSGKKDWRGLKSAVLVESERIIGEKRSLEQRIYISSLPGSDAEALGAIVRGHWSIENRLHWVLDVSLREDQSRIRKGSAPEAAAILRHIVLNLLRMDPRPRGSIKSRRIRAAGVPTYRLQAIMGFPG